jgi:hypothetical protein
MSLPTGFTFSQSNLQDYVDCPRRFQLRYLLNIEWPALQSEPAIESEHQLELGTSFHFLVRQHQSKLPVELLSAMIHDLQLKQWWENYLFAQTSGGSLDSLLNNDTLRFPESTLSLPISRFRLIGKFDLLVVMPDLRIYINDWKTSKNRPRRRWLQESLQSRVYPFLVAKAGEQLTKRASFPPENINLMYWFPEYPQEPELFIYSAEQLAADEFYLQDLIARIDSVSGMDFPLTHDEFHCRFCVYRSLCNRGSQAGDLAQMDLYNETSATPESFISNLDMEQINEVEY